MTIVFTVEVIIKVIANGFCFNGKRSYLREAGNVLDLFVVIFSIISAIETKASFRFVKIIRILKLARPMRLIFRNEKLRISMKVLFSSFPQVIKLLIVVIIITMIFAIIGLELY